jgi:hypothetical protein
MLTYNFKFENFFLFKFFIFKSILFINFFKFSFLLKLNLNFFLKNFFFFDTIKFFSKISISSFEEIKVKKYNKKNFFLNTKLFNYLTFPLYNLLSLYKFFFLKISFFFLDWFKFRYFFLNSFYKKNDFFLSKKLIFSTFCEYLGFSDFFGVYNTFFLKYKNYFFIYKIFNRFFLLRNISGLHYFYNKFIKNQLFFKKFKSTFSKKFFFLYLPFFFFKKKYVNCKLTYFFLFKFFKKKFFKPKKLIFNFFFNKLFLNFLSKKKIKNYLFDYKTSYFKNKKLFWSNFKKKSILFNTFLLNNLKFSKYQKSLKKKIGNLNTSLKLVSDKKKKEFFKAKIHDTEFLLAKKISPLKFFRKKIFTFFKIFFITNKILFDSFFGFFSKFSLNFFFLKSFFSKFILIFFNNIFKNFFIFFNFLISLFFFFKSIFFIFFYKHTFILKRIKFCLFSSFFLKKFKFFRFFFLTIKFRFKYLIKIFNYNFIWSNFIFFYSNSFCVFNLYLKKYNTFLDLLKNSSKISGSDFNSFFYIFHSNNKLYFYFKDFNKEFSWKGYFFFCKNIIFGDSFYNRFQLNYYYTHYNFIKLSGFLIKNGYKIKSENIFFNLLIGLKYFFKKDSFLVLNRCFNKLESGFGTQKFKISRNNFHLKFIPFFIFKNKIYSLQLFKKSIKFYSKSSSFKTILSKILNELIEFYLENKKSFIRKLMLSNNSTITKLQNSDVFIKKSNKNSYFFQNRKILKLKYKLLYYLPLKFFIRNNLYYKNNLYSNHFFFYKKFKSKSFNNKINIFLNFFNKKSFFFLKFFYLFDYRFF